jgi:hypothetical protein
MDPIIASTTFATVVQLLGMYKQEHKDAKDLDHQKFMEWLAYHHHEDIKNLISSTAAIQSQVNQLLHQDHAVIMARLNEISGMLATLLSRVDGFKGLAKAINPSAELSDQPISILRQLLNSDSNHFFLVELGNCYTLPLNAGGYIEQSEPRFLTDDLEKLAELGLLLPGYSENGKRIFKLTRAAAKYIAMLDQVSPPHL